MKIPNIKYILAKIFNRRPSAIRNSVVDPKAKVGNSATLVNCFVDRYSYVYGTTLICTKIGAFCSIAAGCTVGGGMHPTDWVSSSPVFYRGRNVLKTNFAQTEFTEYADTVIGNDVWIGSKCLIKGGVTIGDGAIIGMGSVVTHDVPPYEIWGGNPARCIRKRFDQNTIEKLLELQWWNWDEDKLRKYGPLFRDPQKLFTVLEET